VYRARDAVLDRTVAVKVLDERFAADEGDPAAIPPRRAGRRTAQRPGVHGDDVRRGRLAATTITATVTARATTTRTRPSPPAGARARARAAGTGAPGERPAAPGRARGRCRASRSSRSCSQGEGRVGATTWCPPESGWTAPAFEEGFPFPAVSNPLHPGLRLEAACDHAHVVLLRVPGEHGREQAVDERLEAVAARGARRLGEPLEADREALALPLDQAVGVQD
jgi:hypothetical protein